MSHSKYTLIIYSLLHPRRSVPRISRNSCPKQRRIPCRTIQRMGSGKVEKTIITWVKANDTQLAYLEKQKRVHAISGSSEILLFECDKVITEWDFDAKTFRWISRTRCFADLEKFGNGLKVTEDVFIDTCLLSGSDFLQTIPTLDVTNRNKAIKPYAAVELINNNGRSGIQAVLNNQDNPKNRDVKYLEKFRIARMAIKHHPIITSSGKVEPLHDEQIPNDAHEFISQRLPDELFHYLSHGLINSRVLSWRAFSEIIEPPPVDGGESPTYQTLVGSKLSPIRTAMMNLLSGPLHNYFSHKDLTLKCWFPDTSGKPQTSTVSTGPARENVRLVEMWNVKEEVFRDAVAQHKVRIMNLEATSGANKHIAKRILRICNPIPPGRKFRFQVEC